MTMLLKRAAVFTIEYIHLNPAESRKCVEGLFVQARDIIVVIISLAIFT